MCSKILNSVALIEAVFTLLGVILLYKGLKSLLNKVNEKPTSSRRRLGKLETLMNLFSQERQGTCDVCLIFSLRSKTKLIEEHVHQALVLLAKRQPMLRAVIATSTSSVGSDSAAKDRYFEIIDGEEITDMIDFTSSEAKARQWKDVWQEVAFKERGTRLLWKAVMLQEEFLSEANCYTNTLIFTFNHCCVDGVSSMKFCQQFLRYLNGLTVGSITSDKDIVSLSLSPSFTDLCERPWSLHWQFLAQCLGIPRILKFILRIVIRLSQSREKCNPFFSRFPPNPKPSVPPESNMIFKMFNEIETSNIVKACRLNGCTVTGALMTANHMALCKLLQDGGYSCKDVQVEHSFAINAQSDCQPKPPKEYLGHFVCIQHLLLPYADDENDFWKLAQESTKYIHYKLKEERYLKETAAIFYAFSPEELLTLARLATCNAVSSVGSFDFREEQKHHSYRLHECLFNVLVHGMENPFLHFNVTVNGKMSWAIMYDPSKIVNSAQAQRFANLCFDYFVEMSQ